MRFLMAMTAPASSDIIRSDDAPSADRASVPEMPCAREYHGDIVFVGGFDHLVVADRAAWLDHRGSAGLDAGEHAVGEREERVGGDGRTPGQRLSELQLRGGILRLACGDPRGVDAAHLPRADADGGEVLCID